METVLSLNTAIPEPLSVGSILRRVGRALTAPSRFYRFDYPSFGKGGLLAFAHGEYFALGRRIGHFGFSVRKRKGRTGKG